LFKGVGSIPKITLLVGLRLRLWCELWFFTLCN